ncbi:ABC transporter ATP-binding protein [Pyruvatibacter sp. HU-CL02332]|uniref:ABC transporter ATP-binding protein n=1 Tax=Pyruvatibacter sp. HU-CL02332 TaxID=3127650 RepID=UPI003105E5CE
MTEVSVQDVWMEYGDQIVLERINFDVPAHSFISLVGPSGCGKSTFLRLLLSQERATRGAILIDGNPIAPNPEPDRGVVFQKYSVFPHLTAVENVMLGLEIERGGIFARLHGRARRTARAEAMEMLEGVGLGDSAKKYPSALSGGMQQRLAIAQALIMKPRVLLLDEPFGALDPGIRSEVHDLMLRLWWDTKMTVFMVTHDLSEAFYLGTRVIAFDRKRKREEELERYGATIAFDTLTDPAPFIAKLKAQEAAAG